MKYFKLAVLAFILTVAFTGCMHTEKRRAVTEESSQPFESLGVLEVHIKTNTWAPSNLGNFFKELFTLSFGDTSYETRLKKKLIKESDKFNADQVVKVTFWPDLNLNQFPDGKVYARGEMIRYRRFPPQS